MSQPSISREFLLADAAEFFGMLAELHGPHGSEIQLDVGPMAGEIFDALRHRVRVAIDAMEPGGRWQPDLVDLAAIRVLSAAVLRHCAEDQYRQESGYGFDRLRTLRAKATERLRERTDLGWGSITVWAGDLRFQFPRRLVRGEDGPVAWFVAVPSESSWALVYSDLSSPSSAREEVLRLLPGRGPEDWPETIEEFEVSSYWELEQIATTRARELSSMEQGRP
jgi:hypothetical protein